MIPLPSPARGFLLCCSLLIPTIGAGGPADDEGWVALSGGRGFEAWKAPKGQWELVGGVGIDPQNPKRLAGQPGAEALLNGPIGRTNNLVTKEDYGDIEFHCEFMVPNGSNSGVKFEGLYEVQIADSWGKPEPKASDCGGIYPRAELLPKYHHIDNGYPPRVNATRPPGEWQSLDVVFQAPRFDADGKKTAGARFVKVVLNGRLLHEDLEVPCPTGHAYTRKEVATGPILLQGDHGPVAFRDIRVRPWTGRSGPAEPPK